MFAASTTLKPIESDSPADATGNVHRASRPDAAHTDDTASTRNSSCTSSSSSSSTADERTQSEQPASSTAVPRRWQPRSPCSIVFPCTLHRVLVCPAVFTIDPADAQWMAVTVQKLRLAAAMGNGMKRERRPGEICGDTEKLMSGVKETSQNAAAVHPAAGPKRQGESRPAHAIDAASLHFAFFSDFYQITSKLTDAEMCPSLPSTREASFACLPLDAVLALWRSARSGDEGGGGANTAMCDCTAASGGIDTAGCEENLVTAAQLNRNCFSGSVRVACSTLRGLCFSPSVPAAAFVVPLHCAVDVLLHRDAERWLRMRRGGWRAESTEKTAQSSVHDAAAAITSDMIGDLWTSLRHSLLKEEAAAALRRAELARRSCGVAEEEACAQRGGDALTLFLQPKDAVALSHSPSMRSVLVLLRWWGVGWERNGGGGGSCPDLNDWPSFSKFLTNIVGDGGERGPAQLHRAVCWRRARHLCDAHWHRASWLPWARWTSAACQGAQEPPLQLLLTPYTHGLCWIGGAACVWSHRERGWSEHQGKDTSGAITTSCSRDALLCEAQVLLRSSALLGDGATRCRDGRCAASGRPWNVPSREDAAGTKPPPGIFVGCTATPHTCARHAFLLMQGHLESGQNVHKHRKRQRSPALHTLSFAEEEEGEREAPLWEAPPLEASPSPSSLLASLNHHHQHHQQHGRTVDVCVDSKSSTSLSSSPSRYTTPPSRAVLGTDTLFLSAPSSPLRAARDVECVSGVALQSVEQRLVRHSEEAQQRRYARGQRVLLCSVLGGAFPAPAAPREECYPRQVRRSPLRGCHLLRRVRVAQMEYRCCRHLRAVPPVIGGERESDMREDSCNGHLALMVLQRFLLVPSSVNARMPCRSATAQPSSSSLQQASSTRRELLRDVTGAGKSVRVGVTVKHTAETIDGIAGAQTPEEERALASLPTWWPLLTLRNFAAEKLETLLMPATGTAVTATAAAHGRDVVPAQVRTTTHSTVWPRHHVSGVPFSTAYNDGVSTRPCLAVRWRSRRREHTAAAHHDLCRRILAYPCAHHSTSSCADARRVSYPVSMRYHRELPRDDAAELDRCARSALAREVTKRWAAGGGAVALRRGAAAGATMTAGECSLCASKACGRSLPAPSTVQGIDCTRESYAALLRSLTVSGMRRDGWLVFHTHWHEALASCVPPPPPPSSSSSLLRSGVAGPAWSSTGDEGNDNTYGCGGGERVISTQQRSRGAATRDPYAVARCDMRCFLDSDDDEDDLYMKNSGAGGTAKLSCKCAAAPPLPSERDSGHAAVVRAVAASTRFLFFDLRCGDGNSSTENSSSRDVNSDEALLSLLRTHAAQLLSGALADVDSGAPAAMHSFAPTCSPVQFSPAEVEAEVRPLRRRRFTRHVFTMWEERACAMAHCGQWWEHTPDVRRCPARCADARTPIITEEGVREEGQASMALVDLNSTALDCTDDAHCEEMRLRLRYALRLRLLRTPAGPLWSPGGVAANGFAALARVDACVHHAYTLCLLRDRRATLVPGAGLVCGEGDCVSERSEPNDLPAP